MCVCVCECGYMWRSSPANPDESFLQWWRSLSVVSGDVTEDFMQLDPWKTKSGSQFKKNVFVVFVKKMKN